MQRTLGKLEVVAWAAGLLCAGALAVVQAEAHHAAAGAAFLQPATHHATSEAARDLSTFQGVIGRLEIPALGLKVPILNDYDPASLRQGVGRIRGTGTPGGLGNFVVAGHRDTYFRPLRHLSNGMTMHVVTPAGTFEYVVDATKIVTPDDLDVLDIGDRPEMTLITCYPFDFIGAAPKRFIVRAHLVSLAAGS